MPYTPPGERTKGYRPLKAISLWQPWASLMAAGYKHIETRSWYPKSVKPGQLLAIHAAQHWTDLEQEMVADDSLFLRYLTLAQRRDPRLWNMETPPLGCVVAIARFTRAVRTEQLRPLLTMREEAFGDYSPGRWGWLFGEIRPIVPVPLAGRQSLFDWTPPNDLTYLRGDPSLIVRSFTKDPKGMSTP